MEKLEAFRYPLKRVKVTVPQTPLSENPLPREFYTRDAITVAKELLGKILVRKTDTHTIKCKIVETEAYCGVTDKGSHTYGGRNTERVKAMYLEGGHLYVYMIYGMYYHINVTASTQGDPCACLIRAVEPIEGLERIKENRKGVKLSSSQKELTNGPGKLTLAMEINKDLYGHDLTKGEKLYITEGNNQPFEIVEAKRVNIDYAEEYKDKLWRFYIKGNPFVSVK